MKLTVTAPVSFVKYCLLPIVVFGIIGRARGDLAGRLAATLNKSLKGREASAASPAGRLSPECDAFEA
jgi:hypothetical protein